MKPLVLIVSQDPEFFLIFSHILEVEGFSCALAEGPDDAVRLVTTGTSAAVIVDCQAGDQTAILLCARLKQGGATHQIPVAALVSPKADIPHLEFIKAGIDECFIRPFAPARLIAYLRNVGMRRTDPSIGLGEKLSYGQLQLGLDTFTVRYDQQDVRLPPIEFRILRHLMRWPGKVFDRQELSDAGWPENDPADERSVDVHIARLRKLLKQASDKDLIRTVRSAGYSLAPMDG